MALLTPPPPAECITAFQQGLQTLIGGQISRKNYVGVPPPIPSPADVGFLSGTAPTGHHAQQVYTLALSDLTNPLGTAAARQAGWQIFAGTEQGKTIYGRVTVGTAGWKLTSMFYGDRVWKALQESQSRSSLQAVQQADHELRILAIPGLHIEVSWLVAQQPGAGDLVVPFQCDQPIPGLNGSGSIGGVSASGAIPGVSGSGATADVNGSGAIEMGNFLSTLVSTSRQLLQPLGSDVA